MTIDQVGEGSSSKSEGPGSSPETTDFRTYSSGQATNASVSLFTKKYKLVPAGYMAAWGWDTVKKIEVKTGYLYSGTVSLTATSGCRLFCSALPICSA